MGAKKKPFYRLVVADSRSPRDGRFIEILGMYDPNRSRSQVSVKKDKAMDWLKKGAKPTQTVDRILRKEGLFKELAG